MLILYSLMSTLTEDQLEHHVHNVFVQFGECFTKIKRDNKGMPFAFVQYHVSAKINAQENARLTTTECG